MADHGDRSTALAELYGVSRESLDRLRRYVDLLKLWQTRVNLIGPATVEVVWERHILDSLQLIPLLPPGTKTIAELGSGAGLPGLVLAIATGIEVHLYDSNSKKAAFLTEAIRVAGARASVHTVRLESITATVVPQVECVVARALAPLPLLLDYAQPFFSVGATGLFHKGQDVELELTEAKKYWRLNYKKHQSVCDSRGVILDICEAIRV